MSANVLYSIFQNYYMSGLCISFHSPDTLIDVYHYDGVYFLVLLKVLVLEVVG
jgi:hypothetical protein